MPLSQQFTNFFNQIMTGAVNALSAHPAAADALGEKATALWNEEAERIAEADRERTALRQRVKQLEAQLPALAQVAPDVPDGAAS